MQRSVRENIALPFVAAPPALGADRPRRRAPAWSTTPSRRLQIDARAGGEVRRLSGGNQQKVTIARWVAGGVRTMLCFDPTRGIDIGTKQQIYVLLRDLAEAGAAVLLYTSELKEIQLVCDRAIVIFGGRIVAEIAGRGRRRAVAPARGLQPAAGRRDAGGGRAPRRSPAEAAVAPAVPSGARDRRRSAAEPRRSSHERRPRRRSSGAGPDRPTRSRPGHAGMPGCSASSRCSSACWSSPS